MTMRSDPGQSPDRVLAMDILRASCLALALALALSGCGGTTSNDAGAVDAGASPGVLGEIAQVCLMNNVCGFQSNLGLAADLCAEGLAVQAAAHVVERSPENHARNMRMLECVRTATSCDEYVSCVRFGVPCGGTVAGSCQGTVADRCSTPGGGYLPPIFDCALVGMTCEEAGAAMCVLPASAPECAGAVGTSSCDGNVRVHCRARSGGGAAELREECPAGTTCMGTATTSACMPMPGSCAAEAATCEGDVAVWCLEQDGVLLEQRLDCAAAGRRCAPDARGIARCVPIATECVAPADGSSTARCDGNTLEVCLEGRLERVDCTSVGRSTCTMVPEIPGIQRATVACF